MKRKLLLISSGVAILLILVTTSFYFYLYWPEISVNEYWHTGELNGLNIYINNTKKNVIYAINKRNKIEWMIQGSDYGIARFEPKRINDFIILKYKYHSSSGDSWADILVFNNAGIMKWRRAFIGDVSLTDLIYVHNNLIITNDPVAAGFGHGGYTGKEDINTYVLGEKNNEHGVWAIDLNAGIIVWRISAKNFFGKYLSLEGDKIRVWSGGVGFGRLEHKYLIDSKTGKVEEITIMLDDEEFNLDKENRLSYIIDEKKISLHKNYTNEEIATYDENSDFYNWASNNLNGQYTILILNEIIFTYNKYLSECGLFAFNKKNGELSWQKKYDCAGLDLDPNNIIDRDGVLLLDPRKMTNCEMDCMICNLQYGVCEQTPDLPGCQKCIEDTKGEIPDYSNWNLLWAINIYSGDTMWQKQGIFIKNFDSDNNIISGSNDKYNLKTGEKSR